MRELRRSGCALYMFMCIAGCGDNVNPCDASGNACTWLGIPPEQRYTPDGSDRLHTSVYYTMDTLFAQDGSVWFLDWNDHLVRKVTPAGKVVTVVGLTDPVGFPGDGDAADPNAEHSPDGAPGTDVQLNHPTAMFQMPDGMITLVAWHNHKLRRIDPDTGRVWTECGAGPGFAGDGGPVEKALFKQPSHVTVDEQQNVYILDQQNERIRKIDAQTQTISTVVGNGTKGYAGDAGPALQAQLNFAVGDNPEPSGGLAYSNGVLYIGDTENHRIRRVDLASGMITTIAGTGQAGYAGDGRPATQAQLYHPHALAFGPEGDLYVADTDNGSVRAIDLQTNEIRTVAGTGTSGYDRHEGQLATKTQLNRPFGINFDPDGNLYVSDTNNSRIVKVTR